MRVPSLSPLGSLQVHTQYDDQPLKTSSGDDTKERLVPVHADLARLLAEWHGAGFEEAYGRAPTLDDFIVPDPKSGQNSGAHTEPIRTSRTWLVWSACPNARSGRRSTSTTESGRFSSRYRRLFGELPSETLHAKR